MVFNREELVERSLENITMNRGKINRVKQLPLLGAKYGHEILRVEAEHDKLIDDFKERLLEFTIDELKQVEIGESEPSTHLESGASCLMRAYTDEGYFIRGKELVLIPDGYVEEPPIHKTFFMQYEEFFERNSGYVLAGLGLNESFADFEYRSKMIGISIAECAWLMLGLKPNGELVGEDFRPCMKYVVHSSSYIEEVTRTLELLERTFGKNLTLSHETAPIFLAWLKASGSDSHSQFIPMINKIIENKIAVVEAFAPVEAQKLPSQTNRKEIDSVARILTAMAIDKYGFEPKNARSSTHKEIESVANRLGFRMTAETIRTYLKRGARLLDKDNNEVF